MANPQDYFQSYVRLEPPAILNFDPSTSAPETKNEIVTFLKIHNSAPVP